MRLSLISIVILPLSVHAFVVPHPTEPERSFPFRISAALDMSSSSSPLPPDDFMQRSKRIKSVLEDDEKPPKLFDDDLLDDMQQSLLMLEQRVKEGPGALTMDQVNEFEAATQRILKEMKEFNANSNPPAASSSSSSSGGNDSSAFVVPGTSSSTQQQQKDSPTLSVGQQPASLSSPGRVVTDTSTSKQQQDNDKDDDNEEDGPAYDGTGGMGLARGTANTYIIPGMDEMTPEEYRRALQKSVSDRQSKRHSSRGGVVGNRAALEYLDNLGWGGASSNWKRTEDQDGDDNDSQEEGKDGSNK